MSDVRGAPTHEPATALLPALAGAFGDHAAAVRVGDDACSWEELAGRAHAAAAEVRGAACVAVAAAATLDTVVAVAACLLAGVPAVPVPADSGPDERGHLLRDSGASCFLGAHPWDDVAIPTVTVPAAGAAGAHAAPAEVDPAAPALVMYTSGTTGAPKGVVVSRRAVAADLDMLADAWAWGPHDVLVHGLPLFHVHGLVLGVLGALRTGSRLVHTVRPTPAAYAAAAGSLYFAVPTVWSRVVVEPDHARALRRARLLVSGSAALPEPVFAAMAELCGQAPVERYGMTETLITISTRADGERRRGSVGEPLRGVSTRVVADDGAPVAAGEVGSLEVRTPTMFDGYLHLAEVTARSFTADGWFRTGDAAVVDADGFHRIVGRQSTDLIKTGGYRVGAGEIEDALLAHPGVREAAVIGVPDDDLGQRIVAFVVGDGLRDVDLGGFVASRLSVHKRPRRVHVVDDLPRNAMGKVQKTKLVEP